MHTLRVTNTNLSRITIRTANGERLTLRDVQSAIKAARKEGMTLDAEFFMGGKGSITFQDFGRRPKNLEASDG